MTDDDYKDFCCEYEHEGSVWGFRIYAKDHDDAVRRLRSIGVRGQVLGEHMGEVPGSVPTWIVAALCWIGSIFRRKP